MSDFRNETDGFVLADFIWKHEPLSMEKLNKLTKQELNWKRRNTRNVLTWLCKRGVFKQEDGVITSLISRKEYDSMGEGKEELLKEDHLPFLVNNEFVYQNTLGKTYYNNNNI